jgi:phosphoribosylformimino-5-aminoimidazole carboxamide ribotide isomerase
MNLRILPVLDVMGGLVVRGVGGRRLEYRPVVSRLTSSCAPLDVARAFRGHFGLDQLYLADLDAIGGADPDRGLYDALHRDGFALWVDAGVRDAATARALAAAGIEGVVIGLETVRGPEELADACRDPGERVVFSLDLKAGAPLGDTSAWQGTGAAGIAVQAVAVGVKRLLVLDLSRVGEGQGTGTEELCRWLTEHHPAVQVAAGGGVRGLADLRRLRACGVGTALVASALHDGGLTPEDFAGFISAARTAKLPSGGT